MGAVEDFRAGFVSTTLNILAWIILWGWLSWALWVVWMLWSSIPGPHLFNARSPPAPNSLRQNFPQLRSTDIKQQKETTMARCRRRLPVVGMDISKSGIQETTADT